jgi:dihydrofolate reductase
MNAIFAVNSINGFGHDNDLPWPKSSVDLKRFKQITSGHTVVMGGGTWTSNMPKPLPNRRNIVLSSTINDDRCEVYKSINDMLPSISESEQVFVIGGAKLLWNMRDRVNKVYLTKFNSKETCSVTLDVNSYLNGFELVSGEVLAEHRFEVWKKIV